MSRIDGRKYDDPPASRDDESSDSRFVRGSRTTSWDPLEVWLTRIKQPRDRAARRAAAGSSTGTETEHD